MTKKQTRAQGQEEQIQSHSITIPFTLCGTISFESAAAARKAMGWLTYSNRVVAQVLSDALQTPETANAEQVSALGYLNRDIAELICAIEGETGGVA